MRLIIFVLFFSTLLEAKTQDFLEFSVFSKGAERIELCLFENPRGVHEYRRVELKKNSHTHEWKTRLSADELKEKEFIYYGYRVWGPNWVYDPRWVPGSNHGFLADVDAFGNRFNPNKVLFDPYAKELSHDPFDGLLQNSDIYNSGPSNPI